MRGVSLMKLSEKLFEEFHKFGIAAKTTSISHINELKQEIEALQKQELLDEQLFKRYLRGLNDEEAGVMPGAKTILVIACPQFSTKLNFEYDGCAGVQRYNITLPPNYTSGESAQKMETLLNQVLKSSHYTFKSTSLSEKLLAVRTGLGVYGRNNICYVNQMGSFYHLFSFYTDMPWTEDSWAEKAVMPECTHCRACIKACPMNCIEADRFLIHAERCLTAMNEEEGDFPSWVDQSCHNAIVGCMKCQVICPKNQEFIHQNETEITFSSEETALILSETPFSWLSSKLQEKLEKSGLVLYYHVLPRNLTVLIHSNAGAN